MMQQDLTLHTSEGLRGFNALNFIETETLGACRYFTSDVRRVSQIATPVQKKTAEEIIEAHKGEQYLRMLFRNNNFTGADKELMLERYRDSNYEPKFPKGVMRAGWVASSVHPVSADW